MGFTSVKLCSSAVFFTFLVMNMYHFRNTLLPRKQTTYHFGLRHYSLQPLTIRNNNGRLGNQMFLLATLYGLGRLNSRSIALMPKNYEALSPYFDIDFPLINMPSFRVRDPWKLGPWLSPEDSFISPTSNILSGNPYPTSFTFFDFIRDEVRNMFRFKSHLKEYADNVLRLVKNIRPRTEVFVCVHVRRGDYLRKYSGGWLRAYNGREVDLAYFQKSVQYFRKKYNNIAFLAISDDRNWTRQSLSPLGILTMPESESPGHDMAIMSSCNHTIMTYGTFGFWGSYLAGGEVVYFTDFVKPGGEGAKRFVYDKMYPKEWIGISTTPKGFWDTYTNPFLESNASTPTE